MRTIEKNIIQVLEELKDANYMTWDNFSLSVRDSVYKDRETIQYKLWNNIIFEYNRKENVYYFSGRGWCSLTTKNRLNAILYNFLHVYIIQKNYKWVLNWNNKEYLIDATNIFYFKGDKLYKKASHDVEVLPIENN